ncbi:hypothetical protein B0T19DRAFT_409742 [Cercophora scortea]|uniref:Uncharacterized protein n=1 Tax=Cercophora scortea TaxID=314031 RepID=A0AAE0MLX6_9PEZI|nr:hypothetical protein B0T19DRAFT_409742 [Cercophora scortea]
MHQVDWGRPIMEMASRRGDGLFFLSAVCTAGREAYPTYRTWCLPLPTTAYLPYLPALPCLAHLLCFYIIIAWGTEQWNCLVETTSFKRLSLPCLACHCPCLVALIWVVCSADLLPLSLQSTKY